MNLLETEHLWVRPFVYRDIDALYALYRKIEVMRFVDGDIRTRQQTQTYLKRYIENHQKQEPSIYAIVFKANDYLIGRGGIVHSSKSMNEGEIAFMIDSHYWGRGLATEFCFAFLNYSFRFFRFRRIYGIVNIHNMASINVLKKNRFRFVRLINDEEAEFEIFRDHR